MEARLNLSFQTVLERRFVDGWKGPRMPEPEEKFPGYQRNRVASRCRACIYLNLGGGHKWVRSSSLKHADLSDRTCFGVHLTSETEVGHPSSVSGVWMVLSNRFEGFGGTLRPTLRTSLPSEESWRRAIRHPHTTTNSTIFRFTTVTKILA